MKQLYIVVCLQFFVTLLCAQSVGDFRSNQIQGNWSNLHLWQRFDGAQWLAAEEYPTQNSGNYTVYIQEQSKVIVDVDIWHIPLSTIEIEVNAELQLTSKHFRVTEVLRNYGTLSNSSGLGACEIAELYQYGVWQSTYAKQIDILHVLRVRNAVFSGDAPSKFVVQGNFIVDSASSNVFDKVSLQVEGKSFISGEIIWTSVSGEKLFKQTVFVSHALWINKVGETFNMLADFELHSSEILNEQTAMFIIDKNLIVSAAYLSRYGDMYGVYQVSQNIIITGNTPTIIESAQIQCNGNLLVEGSLHITDKKGVKEIFGNFVIAEEAVFFNLANDRIIFYGDLFVYGQCNNGSNGVFELRGVNNAIYGSLTTARLHVKGKYTNYGYLRVVSDFSGAGYLIQSENAVLSIHSSNTPNIDAAAKGNSVYFTRGGGQSVSCNEFYTLVLDNTNNVLNLLSNCTIANRIIFSKPSFLHCKGNTLYFTQYHDSTIVGAVMPDRGINVAMGRVSVGKVSSKQNVVLPLFTSNTIHGYASVSFTNLGNEACIFAVDSISSQVTSTGLYNLGDIFDTHHVGYTYYISSTADSAFVELYWHQDKETFSFDRNDCVMMHHNGIAWHSLGEYSIAKQMLGYSIFSTASLISDFSPFTIATGFSLLPIELIKFDIYVTNNNVNLIWETASEEDNDFFTVQKSYDGLHFFDFCNVVGNGFSSISHTYFYVDSSFENGLVYYKLLQTDFNGRKKELAIRSVDRNQSNYSILWDKNKSTLFVTSNCTVHSINLYTVQAQKIISNKSSSYLYCSPKLLPLVGIVVIDFGYFTAIERYVFK